MQAQAAYDELIRRKREEAVLASCVELLGWDELTCMPHKGARHRGEQMAFLAGLQHRRSTDPHLGELLAALDGSDLTADPDAPAAVNVRDVRRVYERAARLPCRLVDELARVTTLSQQEWAS